jgi:hypothetical protein
MATMRLLGGVDRVRGWRRSRKRERTLADIRSRLCLRGMEVEALTDTDLESAITSGRAALSRAGVRGSDITAAFVTLARADMQKRS